MSKNFSKLFFRLSITSFMGIYCLALAPSALAKNGNGNGNGNQSQTTNTTTTTTASSGNGNGNDNGNSNQSSTADTTTTTTASSGNGNGNGNGNSNQSSTADTTTTTTASSGNGNGNGNGNSNQSSIADTTTTASSGNGNGNGNANSNQDLIATISTNTTSSVSCSLTDVFLGTTSASACKGPFNGNDTGAQGTLLDDLNKGLFNLGDDAKWELVGKSDSSDAFGFEAQNGKSSGSWSLNQALGSGMNTFVISLKTSTAYSTYLFKDVDFAQTGLTGLFNTIGVALDGSGTQGKALSHASIFKATYAKLPEPEKAKVPEPTASIGLGLVMAGMLINRRRKSQ